VGSPPASIVRRVRRLFSIPLVVATGRA